MSELTLTDLFCGAGGSSSGAANVPGVRVRMAANHWDIAISTHQTNHTDADHDIADLSQVDPRRYPRTTILWASPSCTNHTQAKGVSRATQVDEWSPYDGRPLPKEAAERSRATMWDVPRFAEYHRYAAVVVENVVDAAKWVLFPAWLSAMTALGYEHEIVWLNSMHAQAYGAPAPQSRDRMYVVFWRAGNRRPDLQKWTKPFASCPEHGVVQCVQVFKRADGTRWGRYRAQYVYRCPHRACRVGTLEPGWLPASSIIDWSLRGQRIGDRQKPLATKTRERIRLGIQRHWGPLVVEAAGNAYDCTDPKHRAHGDPNGYVRAWPASEPLKTLHTTASKAVVVADPLLVPVEGREGKTAAASTLPLRTQSTRNETALLIPMRNHN
ncbi:MAG: DNA cytosine methyltransferase, partial [Curtobacterium sp.]